MSTENEIGTARALGWTSLAIAATEIIGQGMVERSLLGIKEHPYQLTALGLREAAAGVTILSQKSVTPTLAAGMWSRVAGDAMDLSLLAAAAPKTRKPFRFALNTAVVLGLTAMDVCCALRVQRQLQSENGRTASPSA